MTAASLLHVEHATSDTEIIELAIETIAPNPFQPRKVFAEEELRELSASIADVGVLQPIMVRPAGINVWELVAGERRTRASILAGRTHIPAIVRHLDDHEMRRIAIIENVQRANLNVMEEAEAYAELIEQTGCTQAEVGKLLGKSRAYVSHVLGMRRLPASIQQRVAAGTLTFGHGKALQGLAEQDPEAAELLADRAVSTGMTVRTLEEAALLAAGRRKPPKRRKASSDPEPRRRSTDLAYIAQGLEEWLDTRVTISADSKPMRLCIDFADYEDLVRIIEAMRAPSEVLSDAV